jgi:hypothetical protein
MENEFDDIDLIDKYLSGELNEQEKNTFDSLYQADAEFRDEVEVYRKIYEGLNQAADEEALREDLDHYYHKYGKDNVRFLNTPRMWTLVGLAASLFIAAGIFWWPRSPEPGNAPSITKADKRLPSGSKKDSGAIAKNASPQKPVSPDSTKNNPRLGRKDAYALAGGTELAHNAIRKAVYPQPLSYTFNKGVLTLYGDPLMGLLFLDIYKSGNNYELSYQSQSYRINQTPDNKPQRLQSSADNPTGQPSSEKITVQVAVLPTAILQAPPFDVVLIGGPESNYKFVSNSTGRSLVIAGKFSTSKSQLVQLSKDNKQTWLFVSGENVFELDTAKHVQTPLTALSGLNSAAARLFVPRASVVKTVILIKK